MSREHILHKVRTALGRTASKPPEAAPPVRLESPAPDDVEGRIRCFLARIEALAGKTHRAVSAEDARNYAARLLEGKRAVASNASLLTDLGIASLPGVVTGLHEESVLRGACASADVGVTSADYALADTGTLVMISSASEARMISLLPPVHLAVVPAARILAGLDELLRLTPLPAEQTSSLVLITGPSRTADIEQVLVRGVHGPGEIHVLVV